jgi:purine-binding chemotaxis protein CheW
MDKPKIVEEIIQIVGFKLDEEEFGVDVLQIREIVTLDKGITRVPKAPSFVEGVINLRGDIIPIVDLRKRFGLSIPPIGLNSRVVIVEIGEETRVGMIVDSVVGVMRIAKSSIEDTPSITKGVDAYYISGVAKVDERLVVLLNLERALSSDEARELAEAKLG